MYLFTHPQTCFLLFTLGALIFGVFATVEGKARTCHYITVWFIVMAFVEFALSPWTTH